MRTLVVVFASLLIAGCSSEPAGPTYAEAVTTYQAEVALLDRLEAKAKEAAKIRDDAIAEATKTRDGFLKEADQFDKHEWSTPTAQKEHDEMRQKTLAAIERGFSNKSDAANNRYADTMKELSPQIELQRENVSKTSALRDSLK